jgi:protein ECT2
MSLSPRKAVVPLAVGDDWQERLANPAPPSVIKRVFFCGVVVENSGQGLEYSEGA